MKERNRRVQERWSRKKDRGQGLVRRNRILVRKEKERGIGKENEKRKGKEIEIEKGRRMIGIERIIQGEGDQDRVRHLLLPRVHRRPRQGQIRGQTRER